MEADKIGEYRSQLEEDLTWRNDELRFYYNQRNKFEKTEEASKFFKLLILAYYAHFEGFFRYSLKVYVDAVNSLKIPLRKAKPFLVVGTLESDFVAYDDVNKWTQKEKPSNEEELPNELPSTRRRENRLKLLLSIEKKILTSDSKVKLPVSEKYDDKNSILYMQQNISKEAMEVLLSRVGLSFEDVQLEIEDRVFGEFLGRRNPIAHGDNSERYREGISLKELDRYKKLYEEITAKLPIVIIQALREKKYLKEEFR